MMPLGSWVALVAPVTNATCFALAFIIPAFFPHGLCRMFAHKGFQKSLFVKVRQKTGRHLESTCRHRSLAIPFFLLFVPFHNNACIGSTAVRAVASKQEVPGFDSWIFLWPFPCSPHVLAGSL